MSDVALELLKVQEVARALKLSTRQIWKLKSAGRLPKPIRLNRAVRWRAADLIRFLELGADMRQFEASNQKSRECE